MKNSNLIRRLDEEWQRAMGAPSHGLSSRNDEERQRYWDAQSAEYDLRMRQDYRRIDRVLNLLTHRGLLTPQSKILDLGCGPGTYTLELARRGGSVIAIDRSAAMGQCLCEKAERQNLSNIQFRQRDWLSLNLAEEGLEHWADVTVSALNPSICNWESLDKINCSSHGACVLVTFAQRPVNAVRDDIQRILTDRPTTEVSDRYNVMFPFGLLYAAGYRPEVRYVPMCWVKEHAPNDAVRRILEENMVPESDRALLGEKIRRYVLGHLDADGIFREHNEALLGILFWTVSP